MAISLKKNETLSLRKDNSALSAVSLGCGWDPVTAGGGFFSQLLGGSSSGSIDLDASCVILDRHGNIIDQVWFHQSESQCRSVLHTGDNLTGEGDGDDETIHVDLNKLPNNAYALVFTINSYRGQTFDKVKNAYVRLVDRISGEEIARYELTDSGKYTGMIMATITRDPNEGWVMKALGDRTNGRTFIDMLPDIVSAVF